MPDATLLVVMRPVGSAQPPRSVSLRGAGNFCAIWARLARLSTGGTLLLLAGCASQGPLRAPSLRLPAAVRGLSAARFGDAVDLSWTAPDKTSDGAPLAATRHNTGPFTLEICRAASRAGFPQQVRGPAPAACTVIARLSTLPGRPGTLHDTLPTDLTDGPARPLYYHARLVSRSGNGVEAKPAVAAAGTPPAAMRGLHVEATAGHADLRWSPAPATAKDERILIRAEPIGVPPGGKGGSERLLAVDAAHDAGGAAELGSAVAAGSRYTAYRSRTVVLDRETLVLNGQPATVVALAAQPPLPAAPLGLEAVASTLAGAEIDLVWQADPLPRAYLVFRQEDGGPPHPLTADPVQGFTYKDRAVKPGVHYRYTVAAVDATGRRGPQSAPAEETLP